MPVLVPGSCDCYFAWQGGIKTADGIVFADQLTLEYGDYMLDFLGGPHTNNKDPQLRKTQAKEENRVRGKSCKEDTAGHCWL